MTSPIAPPPLSRLRIAALGALILLLGAPTLMYPYGRDQAMFAYVGQVWRDGGLPYRDAWDVKLPAVYAIYALVGGVEWGPRLLDLAAVALSAATLVLLSRKLPVPGGSGVAAAALVVIYTLGAFDFWNLAQTETLIAPLATAAVAAAVYQRPFLAGLLAGSAACLKTTAVFAILPPLAVTFLASIQATPRQGMIQDFYFSRLLDPRLLRCVAGWLVPPLLVVLYFASRDGLPFLWELVRTQSEYAGGDPRLAGDPIFDVIQRLGLTGYLPLVVVSAFGLLWLSRRSTGEWEHRSTVLVLGIWWVTALLQVAIQRRYYLYHWAVLTPAAACLTGILVTQLWCELARPLQRVTLAVAGAALIVFAIAPRWYSWGLAARVVTGTLSVEGFQDRHYGVFAYEPAVARHVAKHIERRSQPSDQLLVFAFEPELYLYSGRRSPTRHASNAPILGETSIREARRQAWMRELLSDLRQRPPLYIVERETPRVKTPWAAGLWALIDTQYECELEYGLFRVHRRVSQPARAQGAGSALP